MPSTAPVGPDAATGVGRAEAASVGAAARGAGSGVGRLHPASANDVDSATATDQRGARAAVDDAFGRLALHKVVVGCIADNVASRRVIEKLGFRFVGTQRDHAFRHGRWWDLLGYELTAPEWRAAAGG